MPTKKVQAYPATSGYPGVLWNKNEHKKVELLGLTINNQHTAEEKVQLWDGFDTDASYAQAGTAQAAEYKMLSGVTSGLLRVEVTVPAGETTKLGKEEFEGVEFLGRGTVVCSALSSDCIIIAQYRHK